MELITLTRIPSNEILAGLFGIEWEALRVKSDGKLALSPHPEVFGDKLKNPVVTTDFSESQIEIITPTYSTIEESLLMTMSTCGSSLFQQYCHMTIRFR